MGVNMGKMKQIFMETFGNDLAPNDVAERVYQNGWNAALEEAAKRIQEMPFGADTIASFTVYLRDMKEPIP
jgi:hypothetical protein